MTTHAKSSLEVVEEWKKKCFDFSTHSDDALAPTMLRLLDAMFFILKGDNSRVQRALALLEYERSLHLLSENTEGEPSIRTMMYGVLHSIHGTLLDMTSSKYSTSSAETQTDVIPDSSPSLPLKPREESSVETQTEVIPDSSPPVLAKPREETVEQLQSIPDNNQVLAEDVMAFKEGEVTENDGMESDDKEEDGSPSLNGVSMVPNFTHPFIEELKEEPKEEPKEIKEEEMMDDFVIPNYYNELPAKPKEESIDQIQDFPDDKQMLVDFDPNLGEDSNDITSNMHEMNGTVESEDEAMSARTLNEKDEVNKKKKRGQAKNIPKKRKSSNKRISESDSAVKKHKGFKRNATDLKCPECQYRTRNVSSWLTHLRHSHSTTPTQAGLALRCECGHESVSASHSFKCDNANFTVIAKSYSKTTPQCVLCEVYPKTMYGYTAHIHRQHESTLEKNNVYLKCSCGLEIMANDGRKHAEHCKKCYSHQFTLHKLDESE